MKGTPQVSIIVPTYNESQNIVGILKSIGENMPRGLRSETIVVDDNSPDGTGRIAEEYVSGLRRMAENTIAVIHRRAKEGLSSAILNGIEHARGETIVVMDSDFSHPPQVIPKMIEAFRGQRCDIVVASRYTAGGAIRGWTTKRKLMSRVATLIARRGLGVRPEDPMSGFFAFKKSIIRGLNFDALGYKFLLELLVKTKGVRIREIPYTFENRRLGSSKLDLSTVLDYGRSVWRLYRGGRIRESSDRRNSVRFLSKAARFFTVGLSGFVVNYAISMLFASGLAEFWYVHANVFGIMASISSNFVLNKVWTFGDRDFGRRRVLSQYGRFCLFSSAGAAVQLGMVYWLVDTHSVSYPLALISAVATAAFSNFVLNKRLTFGERIWG